MNRILNIQLINKTATQLVCVVLRVERLNPVRMFLYTGIIVEIRET